MKFLRSKQLPLHLMLVPGIITVFIFNYIPMAGIVMAFQKFVPARGLFGDQQWIGLGNFRYLLSIPHTYNVLYNTVIIAGLKMITRFFVPIFYAILINEVINNKLRRSIQTMVYLPHFLSWVVLGGIIIDILSPSHGIVNQVLTSVFNIKPIFFLADNKWFRPTLIITDIWKEFGYGTVVFLATMTGIDPQLYDSAVVDGANRWHKIWHITLPGIRMVIVLIGVLKLGGILNAGFDQVFNLYAPVVYETGDILDTYIYRLGLIQAQFGVGAAAGLFKSVVSSALISLSYYLAYKFADYRIF